MRYFFMKRKVLLIYLLSFPVLLLPVYGYSVNANEVVTLTIGEATDQDCYYPSGGSTRLVEDTGFTYEWSASAGEFVGGNTGKSVQWRAPSTPGSFVDITVTATITGNKAVESGSDTVQVQINCEDETDCAEGEICCDDGTCVPPCDIVEGESCTGLNSGNCKQCAMHGHESQCGEIKIWYKYLFPQINAKRCNERGCLGDCNDDRILCYAERDCEISHGYPFMVCTAMNPNGQPAPAHCALGAGKCWICIPEDQEYEHWVDYDSCN